MRINHLNLLLVSAVMLSLCQGVKAQLVKENVTFAEKQLGQAINVIEASGKCLNPVTLKKDGSVYYCGHSDWRSGFFPGSVWYLYELSGNKNYLPLARKYTQAIEKAKHLTWHHDIGFIINCSFGNGLRLTKDSSYVGVMVEAAKSLTTRFRPKAGIIQSWEVTRGWMSQRGWECPVIIDNMMNLELLFEATKLTADSSYYKIAVSHADRTLAEHFRADGSCYHVIDYSLKDGSVRNRHTAQGYSHSSIWSRGQAWAIYGFSVCYRETGDKRYLAQAIKTFNCMKNHPRMPKDLIPYWDMDAPKIPNEPRDVSTASCMASALYEMSTFDTPDAASYKMYADRIMEALSSPAYRSAVGENGCFLLKHSVGSIPHGSEIDVPLNYADYYFMEALKRKRDLETRSSNIVSSATGAQDRAVWVETLVRLSEPVLTNLANGTLKQNMPYESLAGNRRRFSHLEAVGRTLCGIAPWLELGPDQTPEGMLRKHYIELAVKGLSNAVDPKSPDFLIFNEPTQPLVDAAFLAQGLLRAPHQLWDNLSAKTKKQLVAALKSSRTIRPNESNWLLFASIVEAALLEFTGEYDASRLLYGVDKFCKQWYVGDAQYGDGPNYHFDYYNSFVIHPMLTDVLTVMNKHQIAGYEQLAQQQKRLTRYAEQQERLISPEGTYPVVGRSIVYRTGAFHALAQAALLHQLPSTVSPAQVRCALTAVIQRQFQSADNFDANGWLRVGFTGNQLTMSEAYINTGSVYLCTVGLLPLGLPATDSFWKDPYCEWTNAKAWSGKSVKADKALSDRKAN